MLSFFTLSVDPPQVDITSGITTVVTLVGQVFSVITSNPLLMVFIGASLLGVGFAIFKKARNSTGV